MTRLLAAFALACACSPTLAADGSDAVTWGALAGVFGFVVLGVIVIAIILAVLSIIAKGFHH